MNLLRSAFKFFVLILTMGMLASASPSHAMPAMEPLFTVTHLCPSPLTGPAGRLTYGSALSFGVTDFLEVHTNLIRDFYQIFNVGAKLSIVNEEGFAGGLTFSAQTYNTRALDPNATAAQVTTYQPGVATAFRIVPRRLVAFVAGQINIEQTATAGSPSTGFLTGTQVQGDLTWAYMSPRKTRTGAAIGSQAVSAGVTYDFTYAQLGFGLSHHWPGFHLGLHYYPNGGAQKFLPILTGGGSVQF